MAKRSALVALTFLAAVCGQGPTGKPARQPATELPPGALARLLLPAGKDKAPLLSLALAPDGKTLAAGDRRGVVTLWDTLSGKPHASLPTDLGPAWSLAFSADGRRLASGHDKGYFAIWQVASLRRTLVPGAHRGRINALAFAPDGKVLAVGGLDDRSVRLWDTVKGGLLGDLRGSQDSIFSLAFSPDGRVLVTAGGYRTLFLWDAATGKELRQVQGHRGLISCVAFAPDGSAVASGGYDGATHLWDTATGEEMARCEGHANMVNSIAFAPDGHTLASAGEDHTVRLWELVSGKERQHFAGHKAPVVGVAFFPDGRRLVSADGDGTLLLWDLTGRGTQGGPQPGGLTAEQRELVWADLASRDAAAAGRVVWALSADPTAALDLLRTRWRPLFLSVSRQRLARLIADLDADRFAVREKAMRELEELGKRVEEPLRQAWAKPASLEARRRLEKLLKLLDGAAVSTDRLRAARVLEVLERVGTAEARQVLEAVRQESSEAWVTRQVQAALERLGRRALP
jgi:hypothetical protein